jgi:predicted metalloprotease with PDZ domain
MFPTTYTLSQEYPHSEFLQIKIVFQNTNPKKQESEVQLPAWRPGRYQLGNFSKNIRSFSALDISNKPLTYKKLGKHSWLIDTMGCTTFIVSYEVYTSIVDGGSTYVDEEVWYLNFINCMMYQPERIEEPCQVQLKIPNKWTIASSLVHNENVLSTSSFYELVDSPVLAAKEIAHLGYTVNKVSFHLWFHGDIEIGNQKQLIQDFHKLTEEQLTTMGAFETSDYHFLFQVLEGKAYHGVEHLSSTCIVLGPAKEFNSVALYDNLLGISSHELFHYWNIIRIRPQEMFPYNFKEENYFPTGFVAEGVTTYYGDLFLVRSGVRSLDWYLQELNKLFKRHFENYGRHYYSVADSSMDLWVDGYEPGTPNRKVSIYVKGAIIALMLDLEIILNTRAERNLDDVMRILWSDFYKKGKGYSQANYLEVVEQVTTLKLDRYEQAYINGTTPLEQRLGYLLNSFGFQLAKAQNISLLAHYFGLGATIEAKELKVIATAPGSPAHKALRIGDSIISINQSTAMQIDAITLESSDEIEITFWRKGKLRCLHLPLDRSSTYYGRYEVTKSITINDEQLMNRKKWLKQ